MLASEEQQQAAAQAVTAAAVAEVSAALAVIPVDDAAAISDWIVEFLPSIAEDYGMALAALAADWYDSLRAEAGVSGSYTPPLPPLPDPERWESMARWVTSGNKTEVEALVSGGVRRTLMNMHRETVMLGVEDDPAADGWARFARPGACGFCRMLAMRGGVYTSSTSKFGSHDHCTCLAGPVWKGTSGARRVDAYRASASRGGTGGEPSESFKRDQERAREWMRDNGLI